MDMSGAEDGVSQPRYYRPFNKYGTQDMSTRLKLLLLVILCPHNFLQHFWVAAAIVMARDSLALQHLCYQVGFVHTVVVGSIL